MNRNKFPLLAGGLGLIMASALIAGGALGNTDAHSLPLLTLLFISELGFFVCLAGLGFGISCWKSQTNRHYLLLSCLVCLLLAGLFAFTGINLWNGSVTAG